MTAPSLFDCLELEDAPAPLAPAPELETVPYPAPAAADLEAPAGACYDVATVTGRRNVRDYIRNGPPPAAEPADELEHRDDELETPAASSSSRPHRCPGCGGLVTIDRRRLLAVHEADCPGRTRGRRS